MRHGWLRDHRTRQQLAGIIRLLTRCPVDRLPHGLRGNRWRRSAGRTLGRTIAVGCCRTILAIAILALIIRPLTLLARAITATTLEPARATSIATLVAAVTAMTACVALGLVATTILATRFVTLVAIPLVPAALVAISLIAVTRLAIALVPAIMVAPAMLAITTAAVLILIAVELILLVIGGIIAIRRRIGTLLAIARRRVARHDRRRVKRSRQALADILDIDIGNRQVAAADAGTLALGLGGDHAIIVLGVLQIIFRCHAIALHAGIARHLQISFENLVGIATNPNLRAATVITLVALAYPPAVLPTTATAMGFTLAAAATTANIVALLHHNVTSSFR